MMSVANEVLTMCGRGESCLERRCWSEPALCCYSCGQNQCCAVVLFVGQNQHRERCCTVVLVGRTSIVLYFAVILFVLRCCTLVLVGTTSIVLRCAAILVDRTSVVLLCWWSQRALGDDDKRRGSATKSTVTAPPTKEMQVQSCTQFCRNWFAWKDF